MTVSDIAVKFSRSIKTISNQKQSALKSWACAATTSCSLQSRLVNP